MVFTQDIYNEEKLVGCLIFSLNYVQSLYYVQSLSNIIKFKDQNAATPTPSILAELHVLVLPKKLHYRDNLTLIRQLPLL